MSEYRILEGDCLDVLATLPERSVQTCITSPPYFGLRDYGTGTWTGGDAECDHIKGRGGHLADSVASTRGGAGKVAEAQTVPFAGTCGKCGATRTDSQIGLEETPEQYVANLVAVFREVRRVLRDDGTVWLNLGDSYNSSPPGNKAPMSKSGLNGTQTSAKYRERLEETQQRQQEGRRLVDGLKPKDLLGIPWMVAQALREPYYTGTIRDERDRIWLAAMIDAEGCMFIHKRKVGQSNGQGYFRKNDSYGAGLEVTSTDRVIVENVMRITDRGSICEQSPEQNARRKQTIYRWNLRSNECRDVIREVYPYLVAKQHEARLVLGCPSSGPEAQRAHESLKAIHQGGTPDIDFAPPEPMFERGWFLRSDIIWAKLLPNPMPESVTDRPTKAHEYLFLLSKRRAYFYDSDAIREDAQDRPQPDPSLKTISPNETPWLDNRYAPGASGYGHNPAGRNKRSVWTVATQPFPGAHFATFPPKLIEPCVLAGSHPISGTDHPAKATVLDPFSGAGTTGVVALRHDRDYIGIELNPDYAQMARNRIYDDGPLLNTEAA